MHARIRTVIRMNTVRRKMNIISYGIADALYLEYVKAYLWL